MEYNHLSNKKKREIEMKISLPNLVNWLNFQGENNPCYVNAMLSESNCYPHPPPFLFICSAGEYFRNGEY
jgi:hypothetical protein